MNEVRFVFVDYVGSQSKRAVWVLGLGPLPFVISKSFQNQAKRITKAKGQRPKTKDQKMTNAE